MTARFTGTTVLVTGGGRGIGRGIALAFAREGASVVVAGRTAAPIEETAQLIEQEGGRATAVTANVADSASVTELIATTVATYGSLDVAVNNAGVLNARGPVADVDEEEEWRSMLDINVTGVLLAMKHEVAHMRANGGGTIVNVSSTLGWYVRRPGVAGYAATKAAVTALTKAAALDHIRDGVRINTVSPGPVATQMSLLPGETEAGRADRLKNDSPIGRVGAVEEVAAAVLHMASPEAAYSVGVDLALDGGISA
ncbi:SDR family oxidoreductase [Nocardiopsis gilva YIM 90087]|uniref:SDR family oxidoreductase n=1 Tax=Nocardiopsis gilva YIM 90087 TaxID=1235441 RepID=A0A223S998_9ACTN|nr:glucose 1-dehydrogenase [Nocardiopsis gilva]ASU84700.1 SDR family oxidoreductase [Nocardiopsis gilva YIM 90087]